MSHSRHPDGPRPLPTPVPLQTFPSPWANCHSLFTRPPAVTWSPFCLRDSLPTCQLLTLHTEPGPCHQLLLFCGSPSPPAGRTNRLLRPLPPPPSIALPVLTEQLGSCVPAPLLCSSLHSPLPLTADIPRTSLGDPQCWSPGSMHGAVVSMKLRSDLLPVGLMLCPFLLQPTSHTLHFLLVCNLFAFCSYC